jgi:hypothetical protein
MTNYFSVFARSLRNLRNFKLELTRPTEVISKEKGFIFFILSKVSAFASSIKDDSIFIAPYQQLMTRLITMVEQNQQLSYQVIQDVLSELYRLFYQAKLKSCLEHAHGPSITALIKKGQAFLSDYDHSRCRMSKKDFTSNAKTLDIILGHREPATKFVEDVEYFQPLIFSGCWKKCISGHYYCIPTCRTGRINMKCPECTGRYQDYHS